MGTSHPRTIHLARLPAGSRSLHTANSLDAGTSEPLCGVHTGKHAAEGLTSQPPSADAAG